MDTGVLCQKCKRQFRLEEKFCPYDGSPLAPPSTPPEGLAKATAAAEPFASEGDSLVGRTLAGRYEIVAAIGSGGMSNVYRARHRMLDRELAIKILKRDLPPTSSSADRFRREAKVASRIEQENVVFLTDFGVSEDGLMFMVMEYVRGVGLHDLVKVDDGLPWRRAAKIAMQVGRALQAAHDVGIVHRDLKPENLIIVDPAGRDHVKVLDFGIAKLMEPEADEKKLTRAGMVFGTPEYMSPEHAQGLELDGRTDLYALGLILWECLVGRRPIQGRSVPMTMSMQLNHDPGPPSKHASREDVPKAMDDIVAKLIQKLPADRFQESADVVAALEAVIDLGDAPAVDFDQTDDVLEEDTDAARTRRPRRGSVTAMDENLADKLKAFFGKKKRRDPRRAREAAILELAAALWPTDADRSDEVARAFKAFGVAEEKLLAVQTDLAWVEDELTRLRKKESRSEEDPKLYDTALRSDMLRSRIDRVGRTRDAHFYTLTMLVFAARPGAKGLKPEFESLCKLNAEVAMASGSGTLS
jgi:serine/threonine protein kinase